VVGCSRAKGDAESVGGRMGKGGKGTYNLLKRVCFHMQVREARRSKCGTHRKRCKAGPFPFALWVLLWWCLLAGPPVAKARDVAQGGEGDGANAGDEDHLRLLTQPSIALPFNLAQLLYFFLVVIGCRR
jgi:hypothetical protein